MTTYPYRQFLQGVISRDAISVLERMYPVLSELYSVEEILDAPVPADDYSIHRERFLKRLKRIVGMLPPHVSPMPNEVFCAIEFLVHEVHGKPILLGQAIYRLEYLGDEIKSDPMLHSLVTGKAN